MEDVYIYGMLGAMSSRKNSGSHIDASLSRQPLVKGERFVRYEVNAVMLKLTQDVAAYSDSVRRFMFVPVLGIICRQRTQATHCAFDPEGYDAHDESNHKKTTSIALCK
jgi:hypothetical protein